MPRPPSFQLRGARWNRTTDLSIISAGQGPDQRPPPLLNCPFITACAAPNRPVPHPLGTPGARRPAVEPAQQSAGGGTRHPGQLPPSLAGRERLFVCRRLISHRRTGAPLREPPTESAVGASRRLLAGPVSYGCKSSELIGGAGLRGVPADNLPVGPRHLRAGRRLSGMSDKPVARHRHDDQAPVRFPWTDHNGIRRANTVEGCHADLVEVRPNLAEEDIPATEPRLSTLQLARLAPVA